MINHVLKMYYLNKQKTLVNYLNLINISENSLLNKLIK